MSHAQPGILEAVPLVARYVSFTIAPAAFTPAALPESLKRLAAMAAMADGQASTLGLRNRIDLRQLLLRQLHLRQLGL